MMDILIMLSKIIIYYLSNINLRGVLEGVAGVALATPVGTQNTKKERKRKKGRERERE